MLEVFFQLNHDSDKEVMLDTQPQFHILNNTVNDKNT